MVNDRWGISLARVGLAYTVRDQGNLARAGTLFAEGLGDLIEIRDYRIIALAIDGVAGLAMAKGQPERAARLFGAAAAMREADGLPIEPAYRAAQERDVAAALTALGNERFEAVGPRAAVMPLPVASAEALTVASPPPITLPPSSPQDQINASV